MPDPNPAPQPGKNILTHQTFCRLCAAMCGIIVTTEDGEVVRVIGDKSHPISGGYTCSKGRASGKYHHHPDRLNYPRIQPPGLEPRRVSWAECLDDLGSRLAAIIDKHGPGAVGLYNGTAGLFDSSTRVVRRLFGAIGSPSLYSTVSIDGAPDSLVWERVSGNPALVGQPDPDAEMVIIMAMNPMVSHGARISMAAPKIQLRKWASHGKLWVIDPRRTETAEIANHHLRPRLGSEYAISGFLIRELLNYGADRAFIAESTTGFEEVGALVQRFTLEEAVRLTGLAEGDLLNLLSDVRSAGRIGLMSGTGVSMSVTATLTLFLNWALLAATGSLDRRGGQWYNPGVLRNAAATGWRAVSYDGPGAPSRPEIPARLGEYSCGVLADEVETGNLRALVVLGGNPIIGFPETARLRRALRQLEVLAVADVIESEMVSLATHVLPSIGQLERADLPVLETMLPKRFVQYTPAVVPPSCERKPLWWMLAQIARRLGHDLLDGVDPDDATDDHVLRKAVARSELAFDDIKAAPTGIVLEGRPFNWVEKHLPNHRWNAAPADILAQFDQLEPTTPGPDELLLIPARQRHKHNSIMNDGMAALRNPDLPAIGIHPDDAARLGLRAGEGAIVRNSSGQIRAVVSLEDRMCPGVVSFPHGFEVQSAGELTASTRIEPLSGMVSVSGIPVRVESASD